MAKKTPWARRIISTTILLALVVGVIFLVVKVVQGVAGLFTPQSHSQSGPQSESTVGPQSIAPCQLSDLQVINDLSPGSPEVGEGLTVSVTLKNQGPKDCSVLEGALDLQLQTGDDIVWTPVACSDTWSKDLLLAPEGTWQGELTWDGKLYEACQPVLSEGGDHLYADSGTYRLRVLLDGKASEQETVVIVQ